MFPCKKFVSQNFTYLNHQLDKSQSNLLLHFLALHLCFSKFALPMFFTQTKCFIQGWRLFRKPSSFEQSPPSLRRSSSYPSHFTTAWSTLYPTLLLTINRRLVFLFLSLFSHQSFSLQKPWAWVVPPSQTLNFCSPHHSGGHHSFVQIVFHAQANIMDK